jgi:hypothetical protein
MLFVVGRRSRVILGSMAGLSVAVACGLDVRGTSEGRPENDASSDGPNGTVDGPTVEDGSPGDSAIDTGPVQPGDHVVFITTAQPTGAIGGLAMADGICQTEAVKSKHPAVGGRAFQAWLSDTLTSAAARYDKPAGRYVMPSGIVVANDFAELLSGKLAHPIVENADGATAPNTRVWTGTLPDGGRSGSNCNNWLTNLDNFVGTTGRVDASDVNWTFAYNEVCSDDWPLYCISQ